MRVSYHSQHSMHLARAMEYKIYGHAGRPVLVFPTSNGRFYQYEDSGMITQLQDVINAGKIRIWTIDGIDGETFFSNSDDIHQRIERHQAYFRYVSDEVLPDIASVSREANGGADLRPLLTGCSMGAFHAINFLMRFPWLGEGVIALSGVYSTKHFFGSCLDGSIYFNSPLDYLANLQDEDVLRQIRALRLTICCGQGAWEEEMLEETRALEGVFQQKSIPAWVDYWGEDASHDWAWWRPQMSYFLERWLAG